MDVGQNSRIFSRHRPNPSFLNNPLSYCYCYSRSLISTKIKFLTSALQFIQRNSLITSKVLKENSVMWLHCEMRTEEYIITSSQNELDNVLKTFYHERWIFKIDQHQPVLSKVLKISVHPASDKRSAVPDCCNRRVQSCLWEDISKSRSINFKLLISGTI